MKYIIEDVDVFKNEVKKEILDAIVQFAPQTSIFSFREIDTSIKEILSKRLGTMI